MMPETGLVSVSFRQHSCEEIIAAAGAAGLCGIEWGSDLHVPAGQLSRAAEVGRRTAEAGLKVFAYGSYYVLGGGEDWAKYAETAEALGAPVVRVWAGKGGSFSPEDYARIVSDARRIASLSPGLTIVPECHAGTLTEDYKTALSLLSDVCAPNFSLYWQPLQMKSHAYNCLAAKALSPYVRGVHVFHWTEKERLPLWTGAALWREYVSCLRQERSPYYLLEFMPDDRLSSLSAEAAALSRILSESYSVPVSS